MKLLFQSRHPQCHSRAKSVVWRVQFNKLEYVTVCFAVNDLTSTSHWTSRSTHSQGAQHPSLAMHLRCSRSDWRRSSRNWHLPRPTPRWHRQPKQPKWEASEAWRSTGEVNFIDLSTCQLVSVRKKDIWRGDRKTSWNHWFRSPGSSRSQWWIWLWICTWCILVQLIQWFHCLTDHIPPSLAFMVFMG